MASFRAALRAVEQALSTTQVGRPVAVRVVAHVRADHGHVRLLAADALAHAVKWLGSEPDRVTAAGSVQSGQFTALARCVGGQTALVSAGSSGIGRPLLAIEVWGNRGMLSWEDDCRGGESHEEYAPSEQATTGWQQLQQSLESAATTAGSAAVRRVLAAPPPRRITQRPPYGVLLVAGDHTHQANYAFAIAADERCRLVALTDEADVSPRRHDLNQRLAQRLGLPLLPDLRAALARDDVQIVSICAEPIRRGRIAVLAAQAGKHLYLDKPLAASLRDADAMVAAAHEAGVAHQMFSLVHTEAADRVRSLIESGELGELTAIHFDLCFAKGLAGTADLDQPRRESPVPERFELVDAKRELTNVGVYPLVQLLTLVGRNVTQVTATTGNYFFREHQAAGMEDFGQLLLQLEGGLVASVSAGRTGWRSSIGEGLNRVFLIGTKGCAQVDAARPRVEVWADVEPWRPPQRNPEDPMGMWATPPDSPYEIPPRKSWILPTSPVASPPGASDVRHFVDCLEQGRSSVVSVDVAAAASEILLAAYQSASSGKTVSLPLPR
jgi:predicted dehydrogenase